jgi:antitoxin component YwqK of YwqJK toxin-antitoxin module
MLVDDCILKIIEPDLQSKQMIHTKHIGQLILLLLIFSFTGLWAQPTQDPNPNGYNRFYYPSGVLQSEGNLVNGKPEGIWKSYHENGKLRSEGLRREGKSDSTWKFFYDSGVMQSLIVFTKGNKEKQTDFHVNGNISGEETFENGIKNGNARYYHKSGLKSMELVYQNGKREGRSTTFSEDDGRILSIITYKSDLISSEEKLNRKDKFGAKQGIWKEFFESGKVKTEWTYKDDLLNGSVRYFSEDGSVKKMEVYRNGQIVIDNTPDVKLEIERDYHSNGRVKSSVNIIDGKKQGVYREYSRTGEITASKMFSNDEVSGEGIVDENMLMQGKWKMYYPGGKLKSEGEYKDGKRTGKWLFYYFNGSLEQEGSYSKGKPDGSWIWYHINGKPLREEFYINGREDGEMKEYDSFGKIVASGKYVDGLKTGTWEFESASYRYSGAYLDDLQNGLWKGYYQDGKKAFEGEYLNGLENGEHKYYYDSGRIREIRSYKLGLPDGEWKSFDETGEPILFTTYRAGTEVKFDGTRLDK